MINSEGFSTSNWLIYPGISRARDTLRELYKTMKKKKGDPTKKMIHTQVLDILYALT